MEMHTIFTDKGGEQNEPGTSEQQLEFKPGEAVGLETYSNLSRPSQDVYVVAGQGETLLKGKQHLGNVRLYRAACALLTLLCLALLLAVIILSVKIQNTETVCPEGQVTSRTELQRAAQPQTHRLGCMQCAVGWLPFENSCFYLSTNRLSWEESKKKCEASGGSLAVITSPNVQAFLAEKGRVKYWIGLKQGETQWTWVNNVVLAVSYWADNASEGDCGILSGGTRPEKNWIRGPCHAHTYYICELQL